MKNVVALIGSAATSSANHILIYYIRSEAKDIFQVIVYDKLKTLLHFDPDQSLEHTPSEAPNQTFVFDGVSGAITEQNDSGDNDNDGDGKKGIKYYVDVTITTTYSYPSSQDKSQDPRNDPKYDSIDWQDDHPDKNLSIEEMD